MWLIVGLLVGAGVLAVALWSNNRGVSIKWYDWLIGLVGLLLLLFTIQNFFGSNAELEPTAANLFLLVTGLPAIILMVIAWQLITRRARTG
jgi:uncharacterized membrane protein